MKLLYLSLFTFLSFTSATSLDPIDKIAALIGKGDTHEIANFFAPNIELTLMDEANTYSKAQAEQILDKFFAQNKPVSCKMLHKVNSSASYRFGVVIINTDKDTYRVAFTLKGADNNIQLIELRIESEKVK
jgi:Na+-transporting NADH:ubiquinone oxidoreductase subunit NqrC